MSDGWYYAEGDKPVGPVPLAELRKLLSLVANSKDVLVWRSGFASWQRAESVPDLIQSVPTPPPIPRSTVSLSAAAQSTLADARAGATEPRFICAVIALADASWIVFFVPRLPEDTHSMFMESFAATVITALGLLLRSNLIRYFGGVFMVVWAAVLLWPLISSGTAPFSRPGAPAILSYYAVRSALSL